MLAILRKCTYSYNTFLYLEKEILWCFFLKYQIIKQIIKWTFFKYSVSLLFFSLPRCYCLLTDQITKIQWVTPQFIPLISLFIWSSFGQHLHLPQNEIFFFISPGGKDNLKSPQEVIFFIEEFSIFIALMN